MEYIHQFSEAGRNHLAGAPRNEGDFNVNASVIAIYCGGALAEITGCFAFWAWLREGRSGWRIGPGIAALVAFA